MTAIWLTIVPWLLVFVAARMLLTRSPRLQRIPWMREGAPLVSIIVPARDEAENISACVATLLNSTYPSVEIVVVDDGSADGTDEIVRILAARSAGRLRLVSGEPLPEGWQGKSWACWQGYRAARGELLLFTDADTRHEDALLDHAVGALRRRNADLVSVLPHQRTETFWGRMVLPQILLLVTLRFRSLGRMFRTKNARAVFANGQFLLFRRAAYEAAGGHEAVRGEPVEDLCLAQRLVRAGGALFVAHAEELMETRTFRTLGGLADGWARHFAFGAALTMPAPVRPLVPLLLTLFVLGFWVAPPVVLVANFLFGYGNAAALTWASTTTLLSVLFWAVINARFGVPMHYAAIYPVGALATAVIIVRSSTRSRVMWKGRTVAGRR
jgi:chlorobactene glucosyltransferase